MQGKVWGTSDLIFNKNNVEVHRITGIKGGKSSKHKHQSKISLIYIESGAMAVIVEKNDYAL